MTISAKGMQQAQADKIEQWSFYQAGNIRQEIDQAAVAEKRQGLPASPAPEQVAAIKRLEEVVADQEKKAELNVKAEQDQTTFDALNFRDDQFDLSDVSRRFGRKYVGALETLRQQEWIDGRPAAGIASGHANYPCRRFGL